MIKLIASDIDETLVDSNKNVPKRNVQALKKAMDLGLIVVLATGRGTYELFDIPEQAGLIQDDRYAICCNGAVIMNLKTKEIVDVLEMDFNYAKNLFAFAYENKLSFYIYTLDKKFGINIGKDILNNQKNMQIIESDNIDFLKDKTILKMIIRDKDLNHLQALEVDVARITNYSLEIAYSSDMYMEINAKGVNKATALKKVLDHYGIKMEESLVIGDNYNDVAMLEEGGISVAVKNARLQVKEVSNYVTVADHNEGAVSEAIEKFILK